MLSTRSGWDFSLIRGLTIREATWLLSELDKLDEQREIRAAEAYHSPGALRERLEEAEGKQVGREAWGGLAQHMAETGQITAEKAEDIRLKNAALIFLEAQRGRS